MVLLMPILQQRQTVDGLTQVPPDGADRDGTVHRKVTTKGGVPVGLPAAEAPPWHGRSSARRPTWRGPGVQVVIVGPRSPCNTALYGCGEPLSLGGGCWPCHAAARRAEALAEVFAKRLELFRVRDWSQHRAAGRSSHTRSTRYLATKFPELQIHAVELDGKWAGLVRAQLRHRGLEQRTRVRHVDVGTTEAFAFPVENRSACVRRKRQQKLCRRPCLELCEPTTSDRSASRRDRWPSFSDRILLEKAPSPGRAWDVVLVDSRFRVACALKSFLHFHREKSEKSLVLVHDFTRLRPYYQEILHFGTLIFRWYTLAVFRPKRFTRAQEAEELEEALRRFEYQPA
ncbi:unnamed protein product [Durusdinium trenchii]|uniref:Uncharacterized protein n=1 Tax=Durusdinium trenchii TaxID=1381693 RepID=A0ABP0IVL2_9DINO